MAKRVPETEDDFIRMQQEAIRRVRDMQERARLTLENAGVPLAPPSPAADQPQQPARDAPPRQPDPGEYRAPFQQAPDYIQPTPHPPENHSAQTPPPEHRQPTGPLGLPSLPGMLNISLNNDQILLLLLIFVLYRDGGDKFLVLALVYIFFT